MAAAVAVVGASVIAVNPLAPNIASDIEQRIEQHAVALTTTMGDVVSDYESVFNTTATNITALNNAGGKAISGLLNQISANMGANGAILNTALTGTQTAVNQALGAGWYGGDDGFVFGLFGGTLTHAGVTQTGSTLAEISTALSQGDLFNAYGYFDEWSLEAAQHITKPLLSPLLSTSKAGATPTATIPANYLKNFTNVVQTFLNYTNLQNLVQATYSPVISVTYGLLAGLQTIGGDIAAGNLPSALADTLKFPADIAGDLLNGYVYPSAVFNPTGKAFTGLLNSGSLLQQLLYVWPTELTTALSGSNTGVIATSAAAVGSSSLTNLFHQTGSLLPNLGHLLQFGNLGALLGPLLAHISAQIGASLAPNIAAAMATRLPSLLLALL